MIETAIEGQNLTVEDQLFILMQTALYLPATRSLASAEAQTCYERAESLCLSLNGPLLLYSTLIGQWRYSFVTEKLSATLHIAKRVYSLTQNQDDPALMMGGCAAMASTLCYLGDFEASRQHAMSGLQIWRSGSTKFPVEEILAPPISCLIYGAISEWYLGEIASSEMNRSEAISAAKELNDMSSLAAALYLGAALAGLERNPTDVDRLTSDLIELSTRYNFALWMPGTNVLRGWAINTDLTHHRNGNRAPRKAPRQRRSMPLQAPTLA